MHGWHISLHVKGMLDVDLHSLDALPLAVRWGLVLPLSLLYFEYYFCSFTIPSLRFSLSQLSFLKVPSIAFIFLSSTGGYN